MSAEDETTLTIHGLEALNEAVDGEVFAEKLKAFLAALAAADIAANGVRRHRFLISALEKNTATARFREHLVSNGPPPVSSVRFYKDGLNRIQSGDPTAKDLPISFIRQVAQLNKNAGRTFAFGEVKFGQSDVIRLDDQMRYQAANLLDEVVRLQKNDQKFFKGYAATSFDGTLKSVDLRGEIKRAYLILTAGGQQIDCNITNINVDDLRNALDTRAIVTGMAFYRGDTGLPVNIDIRAIKVLASGNPNLTRWRGAFTTTDNNIDQEWSRD